MSPVGTSGILKSRIMGHPFQPVWPDHIMMARETLFHYYVWAFLRLFGYNILSYEAALFVIWLYDLYLYSTVSSLTF